MPLAAYCDYVDREPEIPTRMIDRWSHHSGGSEGKLRDWWECGGQLSGDFSGYWALDLEALSGDEASVENRKIYHVLQRCMLKRQYEYIGICTNKELLRELPGCQQRAGLPWDVPSPYDNLKRPITFEEALQNRPR